MILNGKKIRVNPNIFHPSSGTELGGRFGIIVKSCDPYFLVELDTPLQGSNRSRISLHWSNFKCCPMSDKETLLQTA